jgi:hypothetical protein
MTYINIFKWGDKNKMEAPGMHSQEMASQKTERTSDLHGSDSTLSTYVDEKEELQAQAKECTVKRWQVKKQRGQVICMGVIQRC